MSRHVHIETGTTTRLLVRSLTVVLAAVMSTAAPMAAQAAGQWVAPERRARRANPVPASAEGITRARTLYRQECAFCHGASGRGDGSKAADLDTRPGDLTSARVQAQSDGALFWKITEGRGDMPSNRTALSDEQRWMLVNYLRTLAPRQP